jgi:thiosulfate dehydrogenase
MKLFAAGLVVGIITFPLAFYFYFATGAAPVATAETAMPFEKTLAHKALNARIRKEMPMKAPIQGDEPNLTAGAKIYREHCAVCHGMPGQHETATATGMYPRPPKLLEGKGVTDDEPGESYWKVAHGIRLTGMPGFGKSLSEMEMWQVSFLVAQADKLPKAVSDDLSNPTVVDDRGKSKLAK